MSAENTIFISYRRCTSWSIALLIFKDLREHGYDVFMDIKSIGSGQFDTIILNQIAARTHFLVILTPGSVKRCAELEDWLRREIECAIDSKRIIVPILVNNFSFSGTEVYLTGKLSELQRFNGLTLPYEYFDDAMRRLRDDFLKPPVYMEIKPIPPAECAEVQRKIEEVASQPAPTLDDLTAEQYFNLGLEYSEKEDYLGAIDHYTQAVNLNPKYTFAYHNRGNAYQKSNNLIEALADYNEAIRLDPYFAMAYFNRSSARKKSGDLIGAIADYNEGKRLAPQYVIYFSRPDA